MYEIMDLAMGCATLSTVHVRPVEAVKSPSKAYSTKKNSSNEPPQSKPYGAYSRYMNRLVVAAVF